MKNMPGLPRGVVWFLMGLALFVGFNYWLMHQVQGVVGTDPGKKVVAPVPRAAVSGAKVFVIDPKNDLLAPITKAESPQMYLKRRPQENTDEVEYEIPRTGAILAQ